MNNRSVSYVQDGNLFIKPVIISLTRLCYVMNDLYSFVQQLVSDWQSADYIYNGHLDIWGMNGPNDLCTSQREMGCERYGTSDDGDIINPILSARLRSLGSFSFR